MNNRLTWSYQGDMPQLFRFPQSEEERPTLKANQAENGSGAAETAGHPFNLPLKTDCFPARINLASTLIQVKDGKTKTDVSFRTIRQIGY
jgi:hypothetical protein